MQMVFSKGVLFHALPKTGPSAAGFPSAILKAIGTDCQPGSGQNPVDGGQLYGIF